MNRGVQEPWLDTRKDSAYVDRELGRLQEKADSLISSFTGLASIVGNLHSLFEARSVRLLTLLGMTVLPLSFTSGPFSMSGEYALGNSHFWGFPRCFRDIDRSDLRNNLYTTFLEQGNIRRGFPGTS
jgi:hypothetical protein